ncbi:MAG TPA: Fe-S cluster assembly protein SufD [Methylococcus sp.]|nr:Fe-S cluster assembly protein SufD [Methylococcus sp.]
MSTLSHRRYVEQCHDSASPNRKVEPSWLEELRQQALARFEATGFPSPREEEWRYTNIAPIERKLLTAAEVPADNAAAPSLLDRCRIADTWSLVFVDGVFAPEWSYRDALPQGLILDSLYSMLEADPGWLEAHLGRVGVAERHGFIDFNTAFFTDGAVLRLDDGVILEKPIQLLFVSTRSDGRSTLRNLICIGRNAEARVVETHLGAAATGYLGTVVNEILVAENAGFTQYKLQFDGAKAYHFGGSYTRIARDGRYRHHTLSLGGLLVRNEVHAELGRAARTELNGLFLGSGRQHVDNHVRIHHNEPYGTSRVTYRGILKDRSRGIFQGRIVVHPDAQKTDAEMNNRNLLLSEDAEIDTKPQLEIHADDVKCSHGVTVGQLDPTAVFYLESRGIEERAARQMLTYAFAAELVERMQPSGFRDLLLDTLLARFPLAGVCKE